jgi:hypothetical protein
LGIVLPILVGLIVLVCIYRGLFDVLRASLFTAYMGAGVAVEAMLVVLDTLFF